MRKFKAALGIAYYCQLDVQLFVCMCASCASCHQACHVFLCKTRYMAVLAHGLCNNMFMFAG